MRRERDGTVVGQAKEDVCTHTGPPRPQIHSSTTGREFNLSPPGKLLVPYLFTAHTEAKCSPKVSFTFCTCLSLPPIFSSWELGPGWPPCHECSHGSARH